eukprot:gnl/Hemi2/7245_TR2467_c0_g1_i1.p1 gnl/Hemi2/7245_TR2467_c0_g1~~gnl/Hemi2/7245_TR2467_c0_g1_i1.p1  ORF type:complete len:228 (-),score=63.77 gnl/Hemi2/7245_TR2467_c0_g1_i1:342-1025(-)
MAAMEVVASDAVVRAPLQGTIIAQGAEGRLLLTDFMGRKCVVKERFPKLYRHPTLDQKLSARRLIMESRTMSRCRRFGVPTPAIYHIDALRNLIFMEFIEGRTVKELIFATGCDANLSLGSLIGQMIARLHDHDIIHGDLTTSNIMIKPDGTLVAIDFGLSYTSTMMEDKAVDLYVLERALLSTHPNSENLFEEIVRGYESVSANCKATVKKLVQVRARGRKKLALG